MKNISNPLQIALFVSTITLMGALTFLNQAEKKIESENRLKATFSSVRDASGFESFVNDNFGLRETFLKLRTQIYSRILKQSTSSMVILGKDDWLFFANNNAVEIASGELPLNEEELERWKTAFEFRCKLYHDRHARYVVLIAPEKHTIYTEFLPTALQFKPGHSQMDQILNYVKEQPGCKILDVRTALRDGKEKARVYQKSDSHWNTYGAYLAYLELMKALEVSPIEFDSIGMTLETDKDLAKIIGLQNKEYANNPFVNFRSEVKIVENVPYKNSKSEEFVLTVGKKDNRQGRLAYSGHSFTWAISPFLMESFGEGHYLQGALTWDPAIAGTFDVVLDVIVERDLGGY